MELEELMKPFRFVQESPYKLIKELKSSRDQKAIGFLFPDVPEEMIHAYGGFPFPIQSFVKAVKFANSFLPSFACPLNVVPLESALNGELSFIDGLIIPYSCDSMRAFSHLWEESFPALFNHTLWLPKKCDGVNSKVFFRQELLRLKEALAHFLAASISDADLRESIKVYNHNRTLLNSLHLQRSRLNPILSNSDFMTIVRASMYMPKEEHSVRLEELLNALSARHREKVSAHSEFIRIFLFGTVFEIDEIYQCLDRYKMMVVDDSLYNGTRYFNQNIDEQGEPIEDLVSWHFRKDPMSCYHYPKGVFAEHLKQRVSRNAIDGVIYLNPKHCEVLQLDYPMVKGVLDEMKIPLLFIETDHTLGSTAPLKTRLEAFAEMIRERKGGGN